MRTETYRPAYRETATVIHVTGYNLKSKTQKNKREREREGIKTHAGTFILKKKGTFQTWSKVKNINEKYENFV